MRYKNIVKTLSTVDNVNFRPGLVFVTDTYTGDAVYHTVKDYEENRLDLISYTFYNTPFYADDLALYNGIHDQTDIPTGTTLKIPMNIKTFRTGLLVAV